MLKYKQCLCCINFVQLLLLAIAGTCSAMFMTCVGYFVLNQVDYYQFTSTPLQEVACKRLKCQLYQQMPDHLTCCDSSRNICKLKSQCELNTDYSDKELIYLLRCLLGTMIVNLLSIFANGKLEKITKRIKDQQFARLFRQLQMNIKQLWLIRNQRMKISLMAQSFIADQSETCSICLDEFGQQRVVQLNCEHIFHLQCIYSWRQINRSCPMCRNIDNQEEDRLYILGPLLLRQ